MKANIETLLLAPHIDDEVLGAFTFLLSTTFVCYFGVEDREGVPSSARKGELNAVASSLGFEWTLFDHEVNRYPVQKLIAPIEALINRLRPRRVVLPCRSSYNQDHRAVHEAALIACRPHDTNWFVPEVLVYEQPHTVLWPVESVTVSLFRRLDIEAKLRAYSLYASQVREHRSPQVIRALAELRGKQAGARYAEAFSVARLVQA